MTLTMLPQLCVLSLAIAVIEQSNNLLPQHYTILHALLAFTIYLLPFALNLVVTLAASATRLNQSVSFWRILRRFSFRKMIGSIVLSIWIAIGTVLLLICLIVPGLIYTVNRLLSVTIYLIEGQGIRASIWRSKFLMTRGKWYSPNSPTIRISVVMFVLLVVLASLSLRYGAEEYFGWGETFSSAGALTFEVLFGAFSQILTAFSSIVYVNFYYDLRARYEGLDLLVEIENFESSGMVAPANA